MLACAFAPRSLLGYGAALCSSDIDIAKPWPLRPPRITRRLRNATICWGRDPGLLVAILAHAE